MKRAMILLGVLTVSVLSCAVWTNAQGAAAPAAKCGI